MKRRDDLQQGSQEWLEWRKTRITASDVPIIMGESPWASPFMLWEQKLGLRAPQETNSSMQRGKDLEPIILAQCEELFNCKFKPTVMECTSYEWMGASLDGISDDESILLEIKAPNREDHESARKGIVPQKYVGQLNHILFVSNHNSIHYVSFHNGDIETIEYQRNETYITDMLEQEAFFWDCLQEFNPPPLTDRDFVENNSMEWMMLAEDYRRVTKDLKDLEAKQKDLRDKLIGLSQDRSTRGSGLKLTRFMRRGNIRYQEIPELQTINLEQYRSKPSVQWRIS
jgi:putative phage-type endonuclease